MKKMVNGVEVDCSPQEEAAILAEWAANAALPPPPPPPQGNGQLQQRIARIEQALQNANIPLPAAPPGQGNGQANGQANK